MNKSIEQKCPAALPDLFQDLKRAGKHHYNVNDDVERLLAGLYNDPGKGSQCKDLLFGAQNGRYTVTGRTDWDDFELTRMIKAYATERDPNGFVAVADNITIFKALRVVKNRRYPELNRKQRYLALNSTNGQV